jgi:hypothetical protein
MDHGSKFVWSFFYENKNSKNVIDGLTKIFDTIKPI